MVGSVLMYSDSGATCSYQISQVGRALLPILYLQQHVSLAGSGPSPSFPLDIHSVQQAFDSALTLLADLSSRFEASLRSLEILEASARSLGVNLPTHVDDVLLGIGRVDQDRSRARQPESAGRCE
jgi:hypothetical protein